MKYFHSKLHIKCVNKHLMIPVESNDFYDDDYFSISKSSSKVA